MRLLRTLAVLVVASMMLVACSDDDGGDVENLGFGPIEAGDRYVALGDSYTSAPYVGEPVGPRGCLRTDANYPHLLAEAADLELTDVSCGGATTRDLSRSQRLAGSRAKVPPQLDAVTEDTDLVTLSIGGNNGRAFGALVSTCVGLAERDPQGAPCTEFVNAAQDAYDQLYADMENAITSAIDDIRARAPQARVIVVGYPQIFPTSGTCDLLPLAEGDYPLALDLLSNLSDVQQRAADESGVEFLDVRPATKGHDICAKDPWVAGITVASGRTGAPYHPYVEEQRVVADLLAKVIAES